MNVRTGLVFSVGLQTPKELYYLLKSMEEDGVEIVSVLRFQREYDVLAELFHQNKIKEADVIRKRESYPIFDIGDMVIYIKIWEDIPLSDKDMVAFLFGTDAMEEIYYLNGALFEQAGLLEGENDFVQTDILLEERKEHTFKLSIKK